MNRIDRTQDNIGFSRDLSIGLARDAIQIEENDPPVESLDSPGPSRLEDARHNGCRNEASKCEDPVEFLRLHQFENIRGAVSDSTEAPPKS